MLFGQDRTQARSMVISRYGIVATSQTLASQAGAAVLARGGSAVDAAIAANAALGVVEPMSCGMGGDLFMIYRDAKTGKLSGMNASGWAPQGLTPEALKGRGISEMPQAGILSVSVPGAVNGWEKIHQRFGRRPWAELFQPAIHLAADGFPVTEIIASAWLLNQAKLAADTNAREVFLHGGQPPKVGEIFRNPKLAAAYRLVAADGARAYYSGPIAQAILKTSARLGGPMTAADLADFQAEWVEPISTEYRGWKVYELPPNGQGIAALEMLNIMETFDLPAWEPRGFDELHTQIEAQKLAYNDLIRYVADPRFSKVPVPGMLSKQYAKERGNMIDFGRARCEVSPGNPLPGVGDTVYLTVVDRDGNIASLIQSVYQAFGSGVAVDDYGFHLQNRGGLFTLDPAHPERAGGPQAPLPHHHPGLHGEGRHAHGFGIMGGLNQAQAHAQFVTTWWTTG